MPLDNVIPIQITLISIAERYCYIRSLIASVSVIKGSLIGSSSSSSSSSCVVRALEKDSQQYEIDQEKAREALQKLDQQLQDLSKKQVTPPKVKVSDVKITRDQTIEEVPEMSGSFLAFFAAGLFLFTILYNLLYITVIDPSGDAPEPTPVTPTTDLENESPQVAAVLQPLPLAPDVSK
ncbi:conserved hypothetical protein [Ricinus communis]|uniref:Uncharacterized protein n=1 Tax=Ricinus communis TaxID=3988 RepID=B9RIC8_RICCO|nr:conserved hypothetical protein [Ricinus communis]